MIYEFKSKAAGTVVMTQPVAERLLGIIGKPPAPAGVFETEHMAGAITAQQAAIEREAVTRNDKGVGTAGGKHETQDETPDDAQDDSSKHVSLKQRAWPLIDLMKAALAAGQRVTWGV